MNHPRVFLPSLRQLLVFRSVYQLRKISAAAEQLSLTQSAVSMTLKQL
jgi:DNA-binding transcriptional LysR family regulator